MENIENNAVENKTPQQNMKFCKHCGQKISEAAVICPSCGCQVEEIKSAQTQAPIVINNTNTNSNVNTNTNINTNTALNKKQKNKWVAFLLCLFLGYFGVHKFYEGKIGMGVLYVLTVGLFGIGWLIDTIILRLRPEPYDV